MSNIDPVGTVLAKLDGVKQTGPAQWQARCPAHDDQHASLSVGRGDDGRALIDCKAGCPTPEVLKAIGLELSDLFAPDTPRKPQAKARIVKTYDYQDAAGAPAYQVVRFEPKDFRQRRTDGQGHWVWGLSAGEYAQGKGGDWYKVNDKTPADAARRQFAATPRVLYRLPELLAADKGAWVFAPEGEKDVDNLRTLGLVATCNPGGAGKWKHLADDSALHGRRVAIIADKDAPGLAHVQDVAARLNGKAAVVKIIDLPDMPAKDDGQPRKDVSDWIEWLDGRTPEELAAALVSMAEDPPAWTRPPVLSTSTPVAKAIEPYRPLPVDALPEPMRSFVAQAADAIGCDAAFVALPLLAAAASAIGNTRRIELKRGWTEPAIVWAATVGDSGTLKSPALELALRPVRRLQRLAMAEYAEAKEKYEAASLRYEKDLATWKKSKDHSEPPEKPKLPVCWRNIVEDTTVEALAALLVPNWRGLLVGKDELSGWLLSFGQYKQGRGGDEAHWLNMHGGRPLSVDRKTTGLIYVPRAAVSITGGIQPATLQRALGRAYFDNGLAARLLLACPSRRVRKWTEAEVDPAMEQAVALLFDRLYSLEPVEGENGEPEPGIVRLSPEAKTAWVAFYNEHAQEHVALMSDLSAAWSKLEGYAARLALIVHFVRWAAGDPGLACIDVVDEQSIAAGVALSRWFGQETRRFYAILEETDVDRQRRGLGELVQRHGGIVTARDLMRSRRAYPTSELAEQALNSLVQAHMGRWEDAGPTEQGGRPTRRFVLADSVDVDTTPKPLGTVGVSSTGPVKASVLPVTAASVPPPPPVDKTPELPKESRVSSTSTPSRPRIATTLDPDRPGPIDLLSKALLRLYWDEYNRHDGEPGEKHAAAWRAAVTGGEA